VLHGGVPYGKFEGKGKHVLDLAKLDAAAVVMLGLELARFMCVWGARNYFNKTFLKISGLCTVVQETV